MSKVFIKRCSSYDEVPLTELFESILGATNSINRLPSGSTVLLKTNLILRKKPEAAATTHPLFLRALALVLIRRGFKVVVGDSPGGLFTRSSLKSVYEACGLTEAFKDTDIALNYDTTTATVKNSAGGKLREFTITRYIHDVGYIINVPKLKTHVGMVFTGAIKNWYGTVAGERKFDYHVVASRPDDFANILIDIYLSKKPDLTIMDAVVGMDHNGPTAGRPVDINLVLASEDGFALDLTALYIVGIDPMSVPVMKASFRRNLLSASIDDIAIEGESIRDVAVDNFFLPDNMQHPASPTSESRLFTTLTELIKPKVAFDYNECKRCGMCGEVCPTKAITFREGKPVVRHKKCIRCFCCHELCTANAVKIRQSLTMKTILTLGTYNKHLQKSIDGMFGKLARKRSGGSA